LRGRESGGVPRFGSKIEVFLFSRRSISLHAVLVPGPVDDGGVLVEKESLFDGSVDEEGVVVVMCIRSISTSWGLIRDEISTKILYFR
jgi:hypothetical protein